MTDLYKKLNEVKVDLSEYEQANLSIIEEKRWGNRVKKKLKSKNHFTGNKKRNIATIAMFSIISGGMLLSPNVQAVFEELFQVNIFEESANNEEMSFGYYFDGIDSFAENSYASLSKVEESFNIQVPFPEQLSLLENNAGTTDIRVATDENEDFTLYNHWLSSQERNYHVVATNDADAEPKFSAETTDGTAIQKDLMINGIPSKLFGINEIDGYSVYIENKSWKMIISVFDRENSLEGLSDVKEEELIKIAESISW